MANVQKITPFLWFDTNTEEAMEYYTSVFEDSRIVSLTRYPDGPLEGPMAGFEGKVLTGVFELAGQQFMALDGGPVFHFNEAISLQVSCDSQEEVDYYWEKLSAVPESEQCGWCKAKFGLSWQIIPTQLAELMNDPDHEKAARVTKAMLGMKKIIIADLEAAADSTV